MTTTYLGGGMQPRGKIMQYNGWNYEVIVDSILGHLHLIHCLIISPSYNKISYLDQEVYV